MSNEIDLKALWGQQQPGQKPDAGEVVNRAKRMKNRMRNCLLANNLCLVATIILIIWVGATSKFKMETTFIGMVLIIIAIAFYIAASNGLLMNLFKTHPEADNLTYLNEMLAIRKKQERLYGIMQTIYFIGLTAGMISYLIEPLLHFTILGVIVASVLTFGWIAVCWFYIRPRTIRKKQKSINEMIARLEAINEHNRGEAE